MEENILILTIITFVFFIVVGNPYTYALMSRLTNLKIKNKNEHLLLVGIHAIVMTSLMYVAFINFIEDKKCPPPPKCPSPNCPPPPECPKCEENQNNTTIEGFSL